MKQKFKIYYVKYGIANRMKNQIIEVHQKLLCEKYKPLLLEIVEHEMKHSDKGYSRKDFILDTKGFKHRRLYNLFIITTPSAWLQFSPLYYSRGKWYWDWSVFLLFILIMFVCSIVAKQIWRII